MPVSANEYQRNFISSQAAQDIRDQLTKMVSDTTYHTNSSYSSLDGDDGAVSFIDKHIVYLSTHPKAKPDEYMANLRLKTRVSNIKR